MQIENDCDKDVYNGDIGYVAATTALAMAVRGSRSVRRWSKLGAWLRSGTAETNRRAGSPEDMRA